MAIYFSIFLVILTAVCGVVWVIDRYHWAPKRQLKLAQARAAGELSQDEEEEILQAPFFIDTPVQIFPVIAFVLVLRSFLYEPFKITSGSMMPTLLDGDFILVNKFNYGLRDPLVRNKFVDIGLPERGDVIVFKYPREPQIDYIKRVVGLPGDRVIYRNKSLYIKPACTETTNECKEYVQVEQDLVISDDSEIVGAEGLTRFVSKMPNKTHEIYVDNNILPRTPHYFKQSGTARDEFVVPKGHYFVLGDNRDNSLDGRFWGFVPEENLVGEAVFIWMSFDFERTSEDFIPTWVPTGVRLGRISSIE